jgi:hypothetical protein
MENGVHRTTLSSFAFQTLFLITALTWKFINQLDLGMYRDRDQTETLGLGLSRSRSRSVSVPVSPGLGLSRSRSRFRSVSVPVSPGLGLSRSGSRSVSFPVSVCLGPGLGLSRSRSVSFSVSLGIGRSAKVSVVSAEVSVSDIVTFSANYARFCGCEYMCVCECWWVGGWMSFGEDVGVRNVGSISSSDLTILWRKIAWLMVTKTENYWYLSRDDRDREARSRYTPSWTFDQGFQLFIDYSQKNVVEKLFLVIVLHLMFFRFKSRYNPGLKLNLDMGPGFKVKGLTALYSRSLN